MRPAALAARLERDVARGYTPVLVCATIGTTSTTAIDPLAELGPICQKYGVWLHVDAAYAGVSGIVPELRPLQDGVEWADSYTTDAHKWLLTGFDATLFYVADRAALTGALAILPEYLRNAATEAGAVVDLRDWQIPLGRRFRALKLWFVLRWYGAEGLRAHIRSHVALAQELAGWAAADERFDLVAPHPLALVCLRPRWPEEVDPDVATMTLLERLNDGGEIFLTHTTVGGHAVLRVAVGSPATTRAHVERAWTLLREAHDWLAADFAAVAAEQAAARAAEQARAEEERAAREAAKAAEAAAQAEAEQQESVENPTDDTVPDDAAAPAEIATPGDDGTPEAGPSDEDQDATPSGQGTALALDQPAVEDPSPAR
jgi:aromatic-L-amino-acid decarboxylase